MRKINILVIPSDHSGVYFFRSLRPHTKLQEMYGNDFDVTIDHNPDFNDLKSFDKYDIIHVHKGYYRNQEPFNKALNYWKENNITTILDIDDHWDVGRLHPLYSMMQRLGVDKIIIENLKNFDYITTTTDIFANQIKKYNKNVFVFPNAIDSTEKQFIPQDIKSDKIRFGFIMGSSHKHDIELVRGMVDKLPNDILDKIQIVLCGFDTRGTISKIDKETGEITNRNIKPQESVWCYYEQIVTNNYKIISPEYKEFLFNYIPNSVWPNEANETYRRCWTKNINEYATHYNNIDVLLAPLVESDFNKVKSQLKVIEAGFFHKAIIAQDFGPYQIDLIPAIEKGGNINPNGNALMVESRKNHKDWAKNIERLVRNPDLLKQLQINLYNTVKDKYDLNNVTNDRAKFYKEIIKKELN